MGKIKKKGEAGVATRYITRNRAVKKLQVSLKDFRRLCILKGIHPHEPKNKKKANRGSTAPVIFYHSKDIAHLAHEPLLEKLRESKAFSKKIARAIGKRQESYAEDLKSRAPKMTLDHLVKERYPSFIDAVRDLDDALSMIFLFATMPPVDKTSTEVINECQQLSREFTYYVIHSRSLRKVFLSIKGIYYQAEIRGQEVTWLVPYQFSRKPPKMVDFTVMNTFLEFYRVLLGFVNFRLFSDLNLQYPPTLDNQLLDGGADVNALLIRSKDSLSSKPITTKAQTVDAKLAQRIKNIDSTLNSLKQTEAPEEQTEATVEEVDETFDLPVGEAEEDSLDITKAFNEGAALSSFQSLFANKVFFLSREVPRNSLEFVIRAFGGKVGWDSTIASGSPFNIKHPDINYIITDRPVIPNRRTDCLYVQPQWVYDSINARKLIKEGPYLLGQTLPPHLSPFVVYKKGDYIPDALKFQGEIDDKADDSEVNDSDIEGKNEESGEAEPDSDDEVYQKELVLEANGVSSTDVKSKNKSKSKRSISEADGQDESVENKDMAKVMMTRKQRKFTDRIKRGTEKKAAEVAKLESKKKSIKTKSKKN